MRLHALLSALLLVGAAHTGSAQTFRTEDPVIRRMWDEGMNKSQAGTLAQVLMDSSEDPERVTREQATRPDQKMTCEPVAREFKSR